MEHPLFFWFSRKKEEKYINIISRKKAEFCLQFGSSGDSDGDFWVIVFVMPQSRPSCHPPFLAATLYF